MAVIKIKISTRLPAAQVAEFSHEISRTFSSHREDVFSVISYDPDAPTLDDYGRLGRALFFASIEPGWLPGLRAAGLPEEMLFAARLAALCSAPNVELRP